MDGSTASGPPAAFRVCPGCRALPFETSFNTGHGRKKFAAGVQTSSNDWHNMSDQEVLPTWQFAVEGAQSIGASCDFNDAYNGGNSIKFEGMIAG